MGVTVSGIDLKVALAEAAKAVTGELGDLMRDALSKESYEPLHIAQQFGFVCYVKHAMTLNWHLLNHATNFESTVLRYSNAHGFIFCSG